MTITALSQPDYNTDILTNGTLEDTFAQDSDANYDLDIQTSASTTDSQDYQTNQPDQYLSSTDNFGNNISHIESCNIPDNTEVTMRVSVTWTNLNNWAGDLDFDLRITNSSGTIIYTQSWTNVTGDTTNTISFTFSDTLSTSETSENYYADMRDNIGNQNGNGDIYVSTEFSATPTLSSSYVVNSVTQS